MKSLNKKFKRSTTFGQSLAVNSREYHLLNIFVIIHVLKTTLAQKGNSNYCSCAYGNQCFKLQLISSLASFKQKGLDNNNYDIHLKLPIHQQSVNFDVVKFAEKQHIEFWRGKNQKILTDKLFQICTCFKTIKSRCLSVCIQSVL